MLIITHNNINVTNVLDENLKRSTIAFNTKYSIITCETLNKKHCLEVWCMDSMGFSNGDLVFENGEFVQDGKYRLSILKTPRVVAGEIV